MYNCNKRPKAACAHPLIVLLKHNIVSHIPLFPLLPSPVNVKERLLLPLTCLLTGDGVPSIIGDVFSVVLSISPHVQQVASCVPSDFVVALVSAAIGSSVSRVVYPSV